MYTGFKILVGVIIGLVILYFVLPTDPKELAKQNRCPYEGLECPNAHQADSVAYASAEYVIDSLQARIIQLETQLAGYEFKNHSQILKAGITRITRDERGLISVEFKSNGKDYALDYLTDAEFQNEFGFSVK